MGWLPRNEGQGINVEGYSKVNRRHRRSFQDAEMTRLFSSPLFLRPLGWEASTSRFTGCTLFWLFLIAATTGARLEEISRDAIADVRRDGGITYCDIDDTAAPGDPDKHVKTEGSLRLGPIHDQLVAADFGDYATALATAG